MYNTYLCSFVCLYRRQHEDSGDQVRWQGSAIAPVWTARRLGPTWGDGGQRTRLYWVYYQLATCSSLELYKKIYIRMYKISTQTFDEISGQRRARPAGLGQVIALLSIRLNPMKRSLPRAPRSTPAPHPLGSEIRVKLSYVVPMVSNYLHTKIHPTRFRCFNAVHFSHLCFAVSIYYKRTYWS